MRFMLLGIGILALAVSGCGGNAPAKVKGRVVENGQPKTFAATSHSVEVAPVSEGGDVDRAKAFTAVVNEDGTFEVVASGGELPVGKYEFTVRGPSTTKKGGPAPKGAIRELKPGPNDVTLDLAKPGE